jgi:septal ring factor EnvC (AmiA/AmiB activator)
MISSKNTMANTVRRGGLPDCHPEVGTHTDTAQITFSANLRGGPQMKIVGLLVLGILIGCAAAGGYGYPLLQEARQRVTAAEASRDALANTVKEQEEQLKGALAARSSLEADVKEFKSQLGQLQSGLKETKDQLGQVQASLKESKEELARAQSAREAAEEALALAKKEAPGAAGH